MTREEAVDLLKEIDRVVIFDHLPCDRAVQDRFEALIKQMEREKCENCRSWNKLYKSCTGMGVIDYLATSPDFYCGNFKEQ